MFIGGTYCRTIAIFCIKLAAIKSKTIKIIINNLMFYMSFEVIELLLLIRL